MKSKNLRISWALLALIFLLFSCDNVYQGGLAGKVVDADTQEAVSGVNVYAYTSKSARDKAFSSWKSGETFNDPSCSFRATTDLNGNYSFGKIIWKESNSKYGADYSISDVYLIFFSEEYGLTKSDKISIVSSSSNQSSSTTRLTKVMKTSNLTFSFQNGTDIANDTFDFVWSYNNGYRTITSEATTNNGVFNLVISYSGDSTTVTISNISNPLDNWEINGDKSILINKVNVNQEVINVTRKAYNVSSGGISGAITYVGSKANVAKLNGATLKATSGSLTSTYILNLDTSSWNNVDGTSVSGVIPFSSLFSNQALGTTAPTITFSLVISGSTVASAFSTGSSWTLDQNSSNSVYNGLFTTGVN